MRTDNVGVKCYGINRESKAYRLSPPHVRAAIVKRERSFGFSLGLIPERVYIIQRCAHCDKDRELEATKDYSE
jgi:hypothetical protein